MAEPILIQRRIYVSLGLDELRLYHVIWIARVCHLRTHCSEWTNMIKKTRIYEAVNSAGVIKMIKTLKW